jgi:hypothetical protein
MAKNNSGQNHGKNQHPPPQAILIPNTNNFHFNMSGAGFS